MWHMAIVYEDGHTAFWHGRGVKGLLERLSEEEDYVAVMITQDGQEN